MKIDEISKIEDFILSEEEIKGLEGQTKIIIKEIETELKKFKINVEVFVGGSFAKKTLMKKNNYDIDLFIRFKDNKDEMSKILESALTKASVALKLDFKRIHGSRDYYALKSQNVTFEIVPVSKISKPEEAGNSTDLSYFHVKYVNDKIKKNPRLTSEIIIAKAFCRAQGVYGAESWVHGFSGYSLECLILNYGSFEKMLKALVKVDEKGVIIDKEKGYKNKNEVVIEMNESKRKGPIILVDPTYRERNVCSALSWETFRKFQDSARAFLKKPGHSFFEVEKIDENKMKIKGKEGYVKLIVKTHKQEGDIGGAKLEKFYRFLIEEIKNRYQIREQIFDFDEKQESKIYLIVKPNKNAVQPGPPIKMEKQAKIFKKIHGDAFVKGGRLYAPIKVESILTFLKEWKNDNLNKIKSMDIEEIKIN